MNIFGVVFAIAFFVCLAVLANFTRKTVIDKPLNEARARRSFVAEVMDDLSTHRWRLIIVLALIIAVDNHFRISGGLLQSRLVLAVVIAVLFVSRMLFRRWRAQAANAAGPVE